MASAAWRGPRGLLGGRGAGVASGTGRLGMKRNVFFGSR